MDDDLEEERQGILTWLFNVIFGRWSGTEEEVGDHISRLGTINRQLEND
jgi:hypothetical protein